MLCVTVTNDYVITYRCSGKSFFCVYCVPRDPDNLGP
jgi:hypothetical protein